MKQNISGLFLCCIAGAMGAHFGGVWGVVAVLVGEIGVGLYATSKP